MFMFFREHFEFFLNDQVGKSVEVIQLFCRSSMCFLKTFKQLDAIPVEKSPEAAEADFSENCKRQQENFCFRSLVVDQAAPQLFCPQQEALLNILSLVNANSHRIASLDQKLNNNQQYLDSFLEELEHASQGPSQEVPGVNLGSCSRMMEGEEGFIETEAEETAMRTEPLVEQLFGKKKYEYKLKVVGNPPETIYKERNINLSVELVTLNDEKVLNSNIVHLCLAVVDAAGEWVTQNKAKDNFMKGKTEVELYHGEGAFLKVYPREVSRSYPSGKLNFLIYAKQSVLRFSNNNSCVQTEVDSSLIKPLLLQDICIKAKKKE